MSAREHSAGLPRPPQFRPGWQEVDTWASVEAARRMLHWRLRLVRLLARRGGR